MRFATLQARKPNLASTACSKPLKPCAYLEDDADKLAGRHAHWPITLVLAFAASEFGGVEDGHPSALARPSRSVQEKQHAIGIVEDGNLSLAL
jgi:hypothetical protein